LFEPGDTRDFRRELVEELLGSIEKAAAEAFRARVLAALRGVRATAGSHAATVDECIRAVEEC